MIDSPNRMITLLCSGNSMGVYIPAIQIQYQCRRQGVPVEVCVLENVYLDQVRSKIPATRSAFHNHFQLAKKSAQFARDISSALDSMKTERLLNAWKQERRIRFVAFTGFWIPLLEAYREMMDPTPLDVELLRMDAGDSVSYDLYGERCNAFKNVRFFSAEHNCILREFPITDLPPVPFKQRETGIVVHGGGWGIGNYREAMTQLAASRDRVAVLAFSPEEINPHKKITHYMHDPQWQPWLTNEDGQHSFPPLAVVEPGEDLSYYNRNHYPPLFDVIRNAKAIVSKPGGYSLFESFAAATPIVFLEPFAKHEAVNASFWIGQGFGIWFERWAEDNFSDRSLEPLYRNLLFAKEIEFPGGRYYATENYGKV
ncbi:hypothetical protein FHS16_004284 [Paenibacillus endophyticus]|uniref:UDP-glucuronosyltransferase n=1 Tax=Paenibacillus endophyticus TaxID=1294268 RepID=A0A7W5GC84_9BACL|nr:hypothetical protein [Paenibacillus endophyticus]MBB3154208.1 hypothetical protein [Paenibacillus endophyticus]